MGVGGGRFADEVESPLSSEHGRRDAQGLGSLVHLVRLGIGEADVAIPADRGMDPSEGGE